MPVNSRFLWCTKQLKYLPFFTSLIGIEKFERVPQLALFFNWYFLKQSRNILVLLLRQWWVCCEPSFAQGCWPPIGCPFTGFNGSNKRSDARSRRLISATWVRLYLPQQPTYGLIEGSGFERQYLFIFCRKCKHQWLFEVDTICPLTEAHNVYLQWKIMKVTEGKY